MLQRKGPRRIGARTLAILPVLNPGMSGSYCGWPFAEVVSAVVHYRDFRGSPIESVAV